MQTIKRVTEAQVHQAIAALDVEGQKPSAQAIRDRIGYGSFSTITKYIKSYDPDAEEGPDEIPSIPEAAAGAIWACAYGQAWSILNGELKKAKEKADEAQALSDELAAALDDQAAMLAKIRQERDNAEAMASRAELIVQRLQESGKANAEKIDQLTAERDRLYQLVQGSLALDEPKPVTKKTTPKRAEKAADKISQ